MFLQTLGVGIGIGIVHSAVMACVMMMARSNAKTREDETLSLMRERNELDRQKIEALNRIFVELRDVSGLVRRDKAS